MKKILLVENYKVYKNWASKTYEYKLNQIKSHELVKVIQIDEDINVDYISSFDYVIFGWNVISISKFYTVKREYYSKKVENLENEKEINEKIKLFDNIKNKYLIIQDFNCNHDYQGGLNGLIKYLNEKNIKNLITPYLNNYGIKTIKSIIEDINIIYLPHHIDETKFYNMNLKKKYDIFLYGNTSGKFYKFRNRLEKLFDKNSNKFRYKKWNSIRNYFRYNNKVSDKNLSRMINLSWITICTSSIFDLPLGKYFETGMSNSLVCGDIPIDIDNIWKGNYLKIFESDSDEEILNKIEKMLNNKELLIKLTNNSSDIMKNYYLSSYGEKLVNLILN